MRLIRKDVVQELKQVTFWWLEAVVMDSLVYMDYLGKRTTVMAADVLRSMKRQGRELFIFDQAYAT